MLLTANGSQKSDDSSSAAGQGDVVEANVAVRRSKQRKCVIAAVTCVVLGCLVVIGVLVGIKLYWLMNSDEAKYSLQFNDGKRQLDENITSSVKENFVEFHVIDPDDANKQYWVLQDLNRHIQVMRYQNQRAAACFILPLNISRAYPLNSTASNRTSCSSSNRGKTVTLYFEMSMYPIKETSIIGSRGNDLCADLSAFWLFPVSPYEVVESVNDENGAVSCGTQYQYVIRPPSEPVREKRRTLNIDIYFYSDGSILIHIYVT